jgi:predicted DNA-binding antitoxin AbrB/MazE fold protein
MILNAEAVFEDGLLRPIEPLSLRDREHVMLTITDIPAGGVSDPALEMEWLSRHREAYAGQWVALDGGELLAHGNDARAVRDEARAKGIRLPMLVRIPDEPSLPSAGSCRTLRLSKSG